MKKNVILLLLVCSMGSAVAQKVVIYQLMEPHFNAKVIGGTITEVYSTQHYGKTFWWVRLGQDTIIHVWNKHLDTASMKVGLTRKFFSIKRLNSNWWKKEKSVLTADRPE